MNTITKYYIITILLLFSKHVIGQETEKVFIKNAFTSSTLINAQTSDVLAKKTYEFRIQHRFGQMGLDESAYQDFLGLDLPGNIRFAFNYALTDRLYIGVARTKYGKTYDFEAKYLMIKQTEDNSSPFSLAIYHNTAVSSADFPTIDDTYFHNDSITPFQYSFEHRVAYNTQVIISRKISNALSLQVSPTFIYKNLVDAEQENYTIAIPVSGRLKFSLRGSVLFEYAYVVNNGFENNLNPLSIGVEFGTSGHSFQFFATTSSNMLEQHIYTNSSSDYDEGNFMLGFNIKRSFWRKK